MVVLRRFFLGFKAVLVLNVVLLLGLLSYYHSRTKTVIQYVNSAAAKSYGADNPPSAQQRADQLYQRSECMTNFTIWYDQFCASNVLPAVALDPHQTSTSVNDSLCPCFPNSLVGAGNVSSTRKVSDYALQRLAAGLVPGGHWSPVSCIARQRIAVIVPYRDRAEHLQKFLAVMHPLLRRQMLDYTIYVVEQASPDVFNRAALMNVGFVEVRESGHVDCYIFHDVDLLPEDDRNFYVCTRAPRHVGAYTDKFGYRLFYDKMFGGGAALTRAHFERVNGFTSKNYGWGGEDDNTHQRITKFYQRDRYPQCVARYQQIAHEKDAGNPPYELRHEGWQYRPSEYETDGLNSLKYRVVGTELRPLYHWLHVELPPPPTKPPPSTEPTSQPMTSHTTVTSQITTTAARRAGVTVTKRVWL